MASYILEEDSLQTFVDPYQHIVEYTVRPLGNGRGYLLSISYINPSDKNGKAVILYK
jgi:hypothetical protein